MLIFKLRYLAMGCRSGSLGRNHMDDLHMKPVPFASTRTLSRTSGEYSKHPDSLKQLVGRCIDITEGHTNKVIGKMTDIAYQVVNGVGILFGIPQITTEEGYAGHGFSLQYQGRQVGGQVWVDRVDHLALTPSPKDKLTLQGGSGLLYQESEDVPDTVVPDKVTPATEDTTVPVTDNQQADTLTPAEIEVDEDALAKVIEAILGKPDVLDKLVASLAGRSTEQQSASVDRVASVPNTSVDQTTTPKTKLVIKPRTPAATQPSVQPKRTLQQPFRTI
jgi:hypothetical protein